MAVLVGLAVGLGCAAATPGAPPGPERDLASSTLTIWGHLQRRQTVGYRSPYILVVSDPKALAAFAVATGGQPLEHATWDVQGSVEQLAGHVGTRVRITGRYIVQRGGEAPPGSEAARRFVGGRIPDIAYLEVQSIEAHP